MPQSLWAPIPVLHYLPGQEGFPDVQAEPFKTQFITTKPRYTILHYQEYIGSTVFVVTLQVL